MNRPSTAVLAAFVAVVLIGGTNFVAVRFSNRELPPFWGAGLRFAIAGALLVGFARWRGIPLPIGPALPGVALLGVLNFGVSYAFAYWGLLQAPAAMAATFVALVPLMTFFIATALRMERFRWSGVIGGAIAVAGVGLFIGVVFIVLRWTASASAYVTVLFPVVTVAVGAILAGELVSLQFVAGASLVMIGTYVGAFLGAAPRVGPGNTARANLLSGASSQGST